MSEDEQEGAQRTVPFAATLQQLQGGKTARELSEAMQDLVQAVMDTGRAGTLTLQIKVTKSKASGMVEVADTHVSKLPKLDRPVSMFFVTDAHNLVRDNPIQAELPGVRVVEPAAPAAPAVRRVEG